MNFTDVSAATPAPAVAPSYTTLAALWFILYWEISGSKSGNIYRPVFYNCYRLISKCQSPLVLCTQYSTITLSCIVSSVIITRL